MLPFDPGSNWPVRRGTDQENGGEKIINHNQRVHWIMLNNGLSFNCHLTEGWLCGK